MACETSPLSAEIEQQRDKFNEAIRTADLEAIASVLAKDVILVAGTHSDRFIGRDEQLAVWRQEFERGDERLVYVRTPTCITGSGITPMAVETGRWRGEDPAGNHAAGRYNAKWRLIGGAWRLEAEVFMTEECGGESCPQAAEDDP
jgi:ketosteroid isomerase-like protein